MVKLTTIEKALQDDVSIDLYLGDVTADGFKKDIEELISTYSDHGAIDQAIKLLESVKAVRK